MYTRRILVIDDNPSIFDDFKKVLSPQAKPSDALLNLTASILGDPANFKCKTIYSVAYADQGQAGLKLIEESLASNTPYDLAFVDMKMPNGWNGLETIQAIWQIQPSLQVVLCTAYSDFSWDEIHAELSQSDRFFILKKPFDTIEVQQLTEALISRHNAELQLIKSKEFLEAAQVAAMVGHYTEDIETQIATRSKMLEKIFGIPPHFKNTLNGLLELMNPAHSKVLLEAINTSKVSEERFELMVQITRWSDQSPRWIIVSGYWENGTNEKPVCLVMTTQDITHRHELEERLHILEACVSQIDEPVIITDSGKGHPNGPKIIFVNEAFVRKTGYLKEEVIDKNPRLMQGIKTSKKEVQRIHRAIQNQTAIRCELINYTKNGEAFWADLSLTPIYDADKQVSHWIGLIREPSAESVINAIETINQGETWVDRGATEKILSQINSVNQLNHLSSGQERISLLSPKELSIVHALIETPDQSRKELANRLFISEHTLRNHLASIYEKLGIHTRLELHIFCQEYLS